jgi:thiol-disulfide isomerase/thioredoxin
MRSPRLAVTAPLMFASSLLLVLHSGCTTAGAAAFADSAAISGKVVDGSAAPVSGAQITLYRLGMVNSHWDRFRGVGDPTRTDGAGGYRFAGLEDGYYMLSVEGAGFARTLHSSTIESHGSQKVDIVLRPPSSIVIHVEDKDGKPVAGARVRQITQRGVNGENRLRQVWLRTLGITFPPSDDRGDLRIPELPTGDMIRATIEHPGLAPVTANEITAAPGATGRVKMPPGVDVTLHIPVDRPADRIKSAVVDLRHEPFDDASTIIDYEVEFDARGTGHLTVAPGDYSWFVLQHSDHYVTPAFSANHVKKDWLRIEPGRNQDLHFDVRRMVTVRGRIIGSATGNPLPGMSVMGEVANGPTQGWIDQPKDEWSFAGWGETNLRGEYTIKLAPGKARVSFQGEKYVADQDYYEVEVAPNGSTVIADIKVGKLPKLVGVVQNPDGSPAGRAVVRLRGFYGRGLQPVMADDSGRFEIQPEYMPRDPITRKRAPVQWVVAFDPYRALAARGEVRLDQPSKVVLKLEPHDPGWTLSDFSSELGEWERGIVPAAEALRDGSITLLGKTPPEIDGAGWINTGDRTLKLADLRGKYVLLDFWFIGCGPCHGDFPSVKMVHELYKDKGVVVIGVHNSSQPPEAVREHVAKIGLPFPITVDHPDGRTVASFEKHGIPSGYPDYVLISPEGKVLLDDRTIPHPVLRAYKLEIIRKLLLEAEAKKP